MTSASKLSAPSPLPKTNTKVNTLLSFKKLRVGQTMLGCIKTVNDFDLVISLPNHLTGFITCNRISPLLTLLFEAAAAEGGASAGSNDDVSEGVPSLHDWYSVGEWVRVAIVAIQATSVGGAGKKKKRRLELSMMAACVNGGDGFSADDVFPGSLVSGHIVSREDRGYCVSLGGDAGGDKKGVIGFLPDENIDNAKDGAAAKMAVGKTICALVSTTFNNKDSRVVTLTMAHKALSDTPLSVPKADISVLSGGVRVNAVVEGIAPSHLKVSFCGHTGRIDIHNLQCNLTLNQGTNYLEDTFKVGQTLDARIVWVDTEEKRFILCTRENVLKLALPKTPSSEMIGARIENARVCRVDAGLGVLFAWSDGEKDSSERECAYAHISQLSDSHLHKIPQKLGSTNHHLRIIDTDAFAGTWMATLKPSSLSQAILRIEDVHPGMVVRGQVMGVEPFGLVVSLTERIRAVCPRFFMTQVQVKDHANAAKNSNYHIGQKYKFIVVDTDTQQRRITLTRKRALLDSTLPPLTTYKAATVGSLFDGYIVALKPFGAIVRFYGGVKGIVKVAEMCDEWAEKPQDAFFMGQVVRCRVLECDVSKGLLSLSFRRTSGPKKRRQTDPKDADKSADPTNKRRRKGIKSVDAGKKKKD